LCSGAAPYNDSPDAKFPCDLLWVSVAPIFIRLTPEEDARLRELENNSLIHPKVRLRALEIRRSAQGWSAPRISQFVGQDGITVLRFKALVASPTVAGGAPAYLRELLA
jgi:hypothetical protein